MDTNYNRNHILDGDTEYTTDGNVIEDIRKPLALHSSKCFEHEELIEEILD